MPISLCPSDDDSRTFYTSGHFSPLFLPGIIPDSGQLPTIRGRDHLQESEWKRTFGRGECPENRAALGDSHACVPHSAQPAVGAACRPGPCSAWQGAGQPWAASFTRSPKPPWPATLTSAPSPRSKVRAPGLRDLGMLGWGCRVSGADPRGPGEVGMPTGY